MSSLAIFLFESQEIRFANGKPVANDVAAVLGYKDPADAVWRKVFPENKGVCKIQTPGGMQSVTVLEEPGIYQLIFSSKLESAQKFQQWVFGEVLPAIRETGSYSTDRQSIKPDYAAIKEEYTLASFLITDTFAGVELKPELVAGLKLNAAISIAPRLAPVLAESRQYLITNTAQECELLTVTEIGKRLDGISARKVNQMLIDQGFQIKNPNKKSSKDPSYVATNRGSEFSDLTLATGSKGSGTFQQLRWYSSVLSQLS